MNIKNLKISELDVLGIKQNLINYLKSQDEFNSYNFEGSALNILLDILSYNTYYNGFYNNITINEMFLDTALKRSSVVSIAKHFNYFPKTITSSTCLVEITAQLNLNNNNFYIPKYTTFIASKNGQNFSFLLMEDAFFSTTNVNPNLANITKKSKILTLKQGKLKVFNFIYDINNENQKFIIPFENVDSSTLVVKVQFNSENSEEVEFIRAKNITEINENSNVYFIEEGNDGFLQIYFGDGILGSKLPDSSIIKIEIIQTEGPSANGIGITNSESIFSITRSDFSSFSGDVPTFTSLRCKVIQPSFGGSPRENISNIKYNAVRNFTSSERAVTANDYKNIILAENTNIEDIIVWGGEENHPPEYGKVFICAKANEGSSLSQSEKNNLITNLTRKRNIVGVQIEFSDPNIIYLNFIINVKIDPIILDKNINIETKIKTNVNEFFSNNIRKFDADFYNAELIEILQNVDNSIISNEINLILEKRFVPNLIAKQNYILNFNNKISNANKIYSNFFNYLDKNNLNRNCQLEDDSEGNIMLFYLIGDKKIYINKKIGTINYELGIINLLNFKPQSLVQNQPIIIFAHPKNKDIIASRQTILEFDAKFSNSLTINKEYIPYKNK